MKMKLFCGTLYIMMLVGGINGQEDTSTNGTLVTTSDGSLRGTTMKSTNGLEFYAFLGIPYAEPPIGPLRFQDPVPKKTWTGVLDATKDSELCAQINASNGVVLGTEDCLKLNIYTHNVNTTSLKPLYIYIHGGGLIMGDASSKAYPPQRLMNKDIVFITIYYRLGVLGFLNTQEDAGPGNAGLRDQVLAFHWIQKNIATFGGDANRVTIGGQSGGAAAISFHLISPMSKGLFHSAIMQSGSSMASWAFVEDPLAKARELGASLQCPTINGTLLVECLQRKPMDDVLTMKTPPFFRSIKTLLSFVPSVEKRTTGAFLDQPPRKLYAEGKINLVPVISGVNRNEVAFVFPDPNQNNNTSTPENVDQEVFKHSFPYLLQQLCKQNVSNNVTQFNENSTGVDVFNSLKLFWVPVDILVGSLSDILGDVFFNAPNDLNVRYIAKRNTPVYMYVFDYADANAPTVSGRKVVTHAAELKFLFNISVLEGKDLEMSDKLVDLWTNFVINKNPTPSSIIQWKPAQDILLPSYLYIGQTSISNRNGYRPLEVFFWNYIFPKILNPLGD